MNPRIPRNTSSGIRRVAIRSPPLDSMKGNTRRNPTRKRQKTICRGCNVPDAARTPIIIAVAAAQEARIQAAPRRLSDMGKAC